MEVFITGGSGFIGQRIIEKLIQRGDHVTALVHSQHSASLVQSLGATPAWGDINARGSMRHAMQGKDIVYHLAAWYKLGDRNRGKTERINVDGTRNVLEMAVELGIPKIIYTSTVAVYGDTHGFVPDENYRPQIASFLTEYDRTKHIAHYDVALPLIEQGAPIIIVLPGGVYGPGDTSLVGQMMKLYYRGLFPLVIGPELTLTFAYVDDIAEGHLLAAEKGRIGESYHLTGPAMRMGEAMRLWAQITQRRPPLAEIPARWVKPLAPVVDAIATLLPLPEVLSRDAITILEATYLANSDKAHRELGWTVRSPIEGFRETFDFIGHEIQPLPVLVTPPTRRQKAILSLAIGVGVLALWLQSKRK
jgi:nucleoside-diphosphate-sugar epimerase